MKVIDLSTDVAGQWAAKLLAMGGADVVRPQMRLDRPAALAAYLDAFKRIAPWPGATLLDNADVVFTTFDAGRWTGLAHGLDIQPAIVQVTTSTFGVTGPYAGYRGGPLAAWAAGGYLAITGKPDREPLMGPEYMCEYINGYTAAIAAEAALRRQRRTGRGEHVDVCAMESMLPMHQSTLPYLAAGDARQRTGRYYEVYPMAPRPCRDGYVLICVVTDEEFDRFVIAIGRPELLTDARFVDKPSRFENRDALDVEMAPFLEGRDAEDIVEILHASGVTAAKVAEADDIRANPQLAYRGFWQANSTPGNPVPPAKVFAKAPGAPTPSPLAKIRSPTLPLAGVVVADFSVYWAGPAVTRILADLGARVIWVERPGSRAPWTFDADPSSLTGPVICQVELSRNKESLVLDLNSPAGRNAARSLVARCDMLVENNRAGVMDRLGLGPAELCALNPRLVYVSLPGFGSSGPWAHRRSYGPVIEAASSIEGRTGYLDDEPLRLGHPLPDPTGALAGAIAALRGLRQRDEGGIGGWFDIAQLEGYVALSGEELIGGGPLPRIGNRSRNEAQIGVHPCAGEDAWIAIRLTGDRDRARFIAATAVDPTDDTAVRAFTASHEKYALAHRLQAAGIEAFPALNPADLAREPHLRARNALLDLRIGERVVVLSGSPLRDLSDPSGPSPNFGQHTKLLLEELGTSDRLAPSG